VTRRSRGASPARNTWGVRHGPAGTPAEREDGREAVAALCRSALPALLEDLMARTGDRAVAADVAAEAVAVVLAAGDASASRLRAAAHDVLGRAERRGAVPDAARRRAGMPPLELSERALARLPAPPEEAPPARPLLLAAGGPPSDDLLADLEAQARTARRRPARRRVALAGVAAVALVAAVAVAALGGSGTRPAPAARADAPCPQRLSAQLAGQVPVLDAARIVPLPDAGRVVLAQRSWPVDHVQESQARLINIESDVRFWAVPVVSHGTECTPADGACVVAAHPDGRGDAHCAWGDPLPGQRVGEAPGLDTVIGFAGPETLAVRVRVDGRWTGVPTNGGVVATLLPLVPGEGGTADALAPGDTADALPRVVVVDATGGDEAGVDRLLASLRRWGYPTVPRVIRGDPPFAPPEVRWRAGLTDRAAAMRLARRLGTTAVRRVRGGAPGGPPLIVVAGVA
jgi:hypothetical protein